MKWVVSGLGMRLEKCQSVYNTVKWTNKCVERRPAVILVSNAI